MAKKNKEKNKKKLMEEIEIPEGITASIERSEVIMKKDDKETRRKISRFINLKIEDRKIIIESKKTSKREKKIFYSMKAHVKNMIEGLTKGFNYKLQAVSVHFPMTLEFDKSKNELLIKNFLGEKKPRVIKIIPGVGVKITKDIIDLESADVEKAGQVAANIEKGAKVRWRDRRVFQDGIFITLKPGQESI